MNCALNVLNVRIGANQNNILLIDINKFTFVCFFFVYLLLIVLITEQSCIVMSCLGQLLFLWFV